MLLCLCHGVSDRRIRRAVRDGATTVGALARATRAGTGCGSCGCDLKRILAEERADRGEDGLAMAAK
jgi:bacterioferritin-associated ferredoxin